LGHARTKFDDAEKRLDRFSDKLEIVSAEGAEKLPEKAEEETDKG
jgi:tetrahydromethanopterin S-methyltransferase subunit G